MKRLDIKIGLLLGLYLAFCMFVLTAVATAQQTGGVKPIPDPLAHVDFNRVVIWVECAGVDNTTPRGFDSELLQLGWSKWFAAKVQPEVEFLKSRGVKRPRLIFHNPYGVEGRGKNYAFSQRQLCATNPQTRHLSKGLEVELRRLTDAGVECIVYFGTFKGDFTTATALKDGWQSATIHSWIHSIAEALDGGASIAFDASGDLIAASPEYATVQMCAAYTKVWFEPRPQRTHTHLHGRPVIGEERFFHRSDPELFADSAQWAAPNSKLGEVILHLQYPDGSSWSPLPTDTAASYRARIIGGLVFGTRRLQAQGYTVAVAAGWWRNN